MTPETVRPQRPSNDRRGKVRRGAGIGMIALGALLAAGCASQSAEPAPAQPNAATNGAASAVLVTFSGEAEKGGSTPINTVYGVTADGQLDTNVVDVGNLSLAELRGMLIDETGRLYLANAKRKFSQIVRFDSEGNTYTNGEVFASPQTTAGILHPYAMAMASNGDLLISSQDTYVVSKIDGSGAVVPTGSAWSSAFPAAGFLPGTFAPAALAAQVDRPPTPVAPQSGGLSEPRGIARVDDRFFVADDSVGNVKTYSVSDGSFLGVTASFNTGQPTGLLASTDGQGLYVGTQGSDAVHYINIAGCSADCAQTKVVEPQMDGVDLKSPSGLAFGPPEQGQEVLYVASRKGFAINKYTLANPSTVARSAVLISGLTDTPEQLVATPRN